MEGKKWGNGLSVVKFLGPPEVRMPECHRRFARSFIFLFKLKIPRLVYRGDFLRGVYLITWRRRINLFVIPSIMIRLSHLFFRAIRTID